MTDGHLTYVVGVERVLYLCIAVRVEICIASFLQFKVEHVVSTVVHDYSDWIVPTWLLRPN